MSQYIHGPFSVALLIAVGWTTLFSLVNKPGIRGFRNAGNLACYVLPHVFLSVAGWRSKLTWAAFGVAGGITLPQPHRRRALVSGICLALIVCAFALFRPGAHSRVSVKFEGIGPLSGSPTYCWLSITNTTQRWLHIYDLSELQVKTGRNGTGEWMEGESERFSFNLRPHGEFLARVPYHDTRCSWKVEVYAEQLPHWWTERLRERLGTLGWTPAWLAGMVDRACTAQFCGLQYTLMCLGRDPAEPGLEANEEAGKP